MHGSSVTVVLILGLAWLGAAAVLALLLAAVVHDVTGPTPDDAPAPPAPGDFAWDIPAPRQDVAPPVRLS